MTETQMKVLPEIQGIMETDPEAVAKKLLCTKNSVFLDTCFIQHQSSFPQKEELFAVYEAMFKGRGEKQVVFGVTALVLYEMLDLRTGVLFEREKNFLMALSDAGFCIVYVQEECLAESLKPFFFHTISEWKNYFKNHLNAGKQNLTKIFGIQKMPDFPLQKEINSIRDFISAVKVYKRKDDSLAEEMIYLCMMLLMWRTGETTMRYIHFWSDDFPALIKMEKLMGTLGHQSSEQYKSLDSLLLVQILFAKGYLTEEKEMLDVLKGIFKEPLRDEVIPAEIEPSRRQSLSFREIGKEIRINGSRIYWRGRTGR